MSNLNYSERVLDYFRNPRNMGKMENPDGIGKVGNQICLGENEFLHTNSEIKAIKNISTKDRVVNSLGLYSKVGKVFSQNYNGYLLKIKNRMGETFLTPEHLVLAKKVPIHKDKFKRTKGKQELPFGWFHAGALKNKDIILYPIFKVARDRQDIELEVERKKFDYRSIKLSPKVPINNSFLRLCGYYLSEGSLREETTNRVLMFTFNINEQDLVKDVVKIVRDLWNLKVYVKEKKEVNTVNLTINNTFLVEFFLKHFRKGAENKKIPDFLMSLPVKKQRHLICGLWRGDGYVNLNVPRAGYTTISPQLASQLKLLLLRQKIIPSLYTEEQKVRKGVRHKKSYRLHIGDRESLKIIFKILKIKYEFKSFPRRKVWIDNDFAYLPITQIKKLRYKGTIYNLEVPGGHSFITNSLCVHNCGDVMWIYIKVKNGIITDCKFETFGCVAAIATSSVLTELAKGKSFEQALKITNKDVANELGGLPPIKMHCSLLAEEGLRSAIEDYRKKASQDKQK